MGSRGEVVDVHAAAAAAPAMRHLWRWTANADTAFSWRLSTSRHMSICRSHSSTVPLARPSARIEVVPSESCRRQDALDIRRHLPGRVAGRRAAVLRVRPEAALRDDVRVGFDDEQRRRLIGVAKTQCSVGTAPEAGSTKATLAISATEASNFPAPTFPICPRAGSSSRCIDSGRRCSVIFSAEATASQRPSLDKTTPRSLLPEPRSSGAAAAAALPAVRRVDLDDGHAQLSAAATTTLHGALSSWRNVAHRADRGRAGGLGFLFLIAFGVFGVFGVEGLEGHESVA